MPALSPQSAQHTLGHVNCPACEELKRMIVRTGELGVLTFAEVWPYFIEEKSQEIGPKTLKSYKEYFRALNPFFGDVVLKDIHIGHIVAYRSSRVTAGPSLINHEVNALSQILNKAGLWAALARFYKPLRIANTGPGQALLEEEALWLLEVASTGKRWQVAYLGSMISANTTCGHGEIRNLRLRDINLKDGIITIVDGAKNKYRVRTIPMNPDTQWAIEKLIGMALEKGSYLPEHYLIPARPGRLERDAKEKNSTNKSHAIPTKPLGSWKTAWHSLRREAAKKYPKLGTIRMHDLRHHAITTLLENPNISERTIQDICGHVSKKMLERYSHIRIHRKRAALDALESLRKHPATVLNPPTRKESIQ